MTKLEDRIRSGLHETARLIPERPPRPAVERARSRRRWGAGAAAVAVVAVLVLFSPLFFLAGPDSTGAPLDRPTPTGPTPEGVVVTDSGLQFAQPEHVHLRYTQNLSLSCDGLQAVDDGGFDDFEMDLWMDHETGFTRIGIEYPDGSTHDLILEGWPGSWSRAWGRGSDLGRNAGCRELLDDGGYSQTIAGWAFQDASELWFTAYLQPVAPGEEGVIINHEGLPTEATRVGSGAYLIESLSPNGTHIRHGFVLDEPEVRVTGEQRYMKVPGQFEVSAGIVVQETGPAPMPEDVFDTSGFTPLWGGEPVATTKATTP